MSKSIRISDRLYSQAQTSAMLLHRSLNEQIEHWAALGQILEKQLSGDELAAALIRRGHELDEEAVKAGKLRQEDLFIFRPDVAQKMDLQLTPATLDGVEL